jgi:small subunit ribosomal protein S15
LTNLIKNEIHLKKHLEINKNDMHAKRGLMLTNSKINRLVKYYKNTNKLPSNWKYDSKSAELLVK